jgi:hypothetical protein
MPDGPLLPELARSLRSLGVPRDAASEAAHRAVFTPLLHARASATESDAAGALAALRGSALSTRIEAGVIDAAEAGVTDPARARARVAQAEEIVEPLRAALLALDEAAEGVRVGTPAWDAWVGHLRHVFAAADVACQQLARLLATQDDEPTERRWFERGVM